MVSFLRKFSWRANNSFSHNQQLLFPQQQAGQELSWLPKLLQLTCLKPNYTLRQQMVTGYGITAFVTVFFVVSMAIISAQSAGSYVREESIDLFKTQLNEVLQESGVFTGDILDKKLDSLRGSANLLVEIVRDRIVGYPNEGWENDSHVPFVDMKTGRPMYPLKADLLPRDFTIKTNLDKNDVTNLRENLQERSEDYIGTPLLDLWNTESAMFNFQGNCDPTLTDPAALGFYPFCTDENNDASLGGKLNPTNTLAPLEQKAADIGVFTKAIFEAQHLVHAVGVWFVNSGAGAGVQFPGFAATPGLEFVSSGCDWMRETNTLTGRPYGTEEEINRCTPKGLRSSTREYNGLEREWCADQALHPGETRIFGPYNDATGLGWRLTLGKAVFDRKTNELIACTHIDLSKMQARRLLADISEDMPSDIVVTKTDGTVVVGADQIDANGTITNPIPALWETDYIDFETYRKLTDDLAFWEDEWDIESARNTYNFSLKSNGRYFTVFPSPIPPEEYDPLYRPDFYIFGSIDAEVQDNKIEEIAEIISADVTELIIIAVALATIGLCIMMTVITIVAGVLTGPLEWMEKKAKEIVNHGDMRAGDSLNVVDEDGKQIHFCSFLPRNEVQELVTEFQSMVSGFSGEGASSVAVPRNTESKNLITWKEDFRKFYNLSPNLEHKLKEEMNMMTRSVSRRMSKKSAMRAGSFRKSFRKSFSGRSSAAWRNSSSFPLSGSDFELILAAAKEADDEDISEPKMADASVPIFRSTQMSGESTTEYRPQSFPSSTHNLLSSISCASSSKPLDSEKSESEVIFQRPVTRINIGSNFPQAADKSRLPFDEETSMRKYGKKLIRSPLYWNVLCWIVLPLLTFIIAIITTVRFQMVDTYPNWINEANNTSFDLEVEHLKSSTDLIKKHMEQLFVEPINDLHTITRLSGWLLFDAVNRSDGFTDMEMELVEECKFFDEIWECPFVTSDTRSPCSCDWNDPWGWGWGSTCEERDNMTLASDPRYLQKLWYVNQRPNPDGVYPKVDYSANSTTWYTDPNQMDGSEKGSNATGHATTYDRLLAISALSTIIFPVYNYGVESRGEGSSSSAISGYIAFDIDGAYSGFSGCNYDAASYARFVSAEGNNAYQITDNCPKGKFGYDPRCRGWYDNAKQSGITNDDDVYITPPYRYATTDQVGVTAVSPLFDPKTGEFVANTLIDFSTTEISKIVDRSKFRSYAVIIPNATDGQNVVAYSDFDDESTPESIYDLLAPNDPPGTPNYDRFEEIIQDMENKGSGASCDLYRTDEIGVQHQICYVYEPIFNRELRLVQSDDFSRGAVPSTEFLYSLIILQDVNEISSEFTERSLDISRVLNRISIIYVITASLATLLCIFVTAMISMYVTRPTIQLLCTVKQVNAGGMEHDMPPLTGGSREDHRVYASFAKLYKTVRMSNSAFFVGDLSLAHRIALDALRLFRKIGDPKAIAIACNNMGNTLLAWTVECREPGTSLELEGDECAYCTEAAIKYYTEAVALGTKDFEGASGDSEKAQFAQQLADRHFNRAMCLLLTADDPCASNNAKETALDDLYLVKQYDQGVKEYMLHSKTLLENSDVIFERSLRRLNGLVALIDIEPDVWDVWDIYELVDQADLMLQAAWNQDQAPLFHNMTKIGRLQELEAAVTGIELVSGKSNDAVQLAMRMLIEDEYLLDSSFIEVADCILQCTGNHPKDGKDLDNDDEQEDEDGQDNKDEEQESTFADACISEMKLEFKSMRKSVMRNSLDLGRTFVFCIDLKGEWNGQSLLLDLRRAILTFYEMNFQPNDTVGIVTFVPKDGTLKKVQPFSAKDLFAIEKYPHREALVAATTGVACSRYTPALQGAIDMALEVESSSASDVCLLYVSDGGAYDEEIFSSLRTRLQTSSRTGKGHKSSRSIPMASSIDLVIVGLVSSQADLTSRTSQSSIHIRSNSLRQITDPEVTFEESCKGLVTATRSRASIYLEANPDQLEDVFRRATASINQGTSFPGIRLQRALTMQKF